MLKKALRSFSKNNIGKYLLILLGSLSWSLVMVRSGLCWDEGCAGGLGFWGANGHDGVWHIALTESLSRGGFETPVFSGASIQNYHIGFDLILAGLHKITSVPIVNLYFQVLPIIFSISIGFLVYKFVESWQKSKTSAWWAVFFVYFGGSWGWFVSLVRGQGWGGESMFWSMQAISTLINPPFALSLIFLSLGLIFLLKLKEKPTFINVLLSILFFGVLGGIKIYAGLLALTALFVAGIHSLVVNRQSLIIKIFLGSLAVFLLLYLPFNKSSAGLIFWQPFWFLESMMALSDRVGWQKMYSAMTTYKLGHIWFKAVLAYGAVFVIFVIGNFGTRIIALKSLFRRSKEFFLASPIDVFLLIIILAGITVPMFFVQVAVPWNTIQFFYYSLFFAGIASGIVVAEFTKNLHIRTFLNKASPFEAEETGKSEESEENRKNDLEKAKKPYPLGVGNSTLMIQIIKVIIILLTIPTTIVSLGSYLGSVPPAVLPKSEAEALKFLSEEEDGVVLTFPYNENLAKVAIPPKPLYLYATTAYVSAFSGKQVFFEDQTNLDIMQYPWHERKRLVENFLNTLNAEDAKRFLDENNIKYVYWLKDQHAKVGDKQMGLTKIFDNGDVKIFKVN